MTRPVAVVGATGRMGRAVLAALHDVPDLYPAVALVRPGHAWEGRAGSPPVELLPDLYTTADLSAALASAAVVIDFSTPTLLPALARAAADAGIPLVTGTTGLDAAAWDALVEAAQRVAVVAAPNMSVGVTALVALAEEAAARLGPGWEAEIVEIHHRGKKDSPSGTALALGHAVARARGADLAEVEAYRGRGITGPRAPGEIGIAAVRGGDVVGEHVVYLFGEGERIELGHRATDRGIFARGAVRAARWALDAPAGLWTMRDVLGMAR